MINLIKFLLVFSCIAVSQTRSYNYSSCSSDTILNPASLECKVCAQSQVPNKYQTISTSCQCRNGFVPSSTISSASTCTNLTSASNCGSSNSFYDIFELNGNRKNPTACTPCVNSSTDV